MMEVKSLQMLVLETWAVKSLTKPVRPLTRTARPLLRMLSLQVLPPGRDWPWNWGCRVLLMRTATSLTRAAKPLTRTRKLLVRAMMPLMRSAELLTEATSLQAVVLSMWAAKLLGARSLQTLVLLSWAEKPLVEVMSLHALILSM